jgi:ribosome biogenesis protein ERB1
MPKAIAAPKRDLPIHAESYNPPEEYLLDEEEKEEYEKKDPEDRALNYLPQKFEALRKVPLY